MINDFSCTTMKLATNELPLTDDEAAADTAAAKFTHPLSISEDEEVADESGECEDTVEDFKKPQSSIEENTKK